MELLYYPQSGRNETGRFCHKRFSENGLWREENRWEVYSIGERIVTNGSFSIGAQWPFANENLGSVDCTRPNSYADHARDLVASATANWSETIAGAVSAIACSIRQ